MLIFDIFIEGFDGKVFVTDIVRLVEDIQKNEKKSENSLYPCRDVIGSVSWHPTGNHNSAFKLCILKKLSKMDLIHNCHVTHIMIHKVFII